MYFIPFERQAANTLAALLQMSGTNFITSA